MEDRIRIIDYNHLVFGAIYSKYRVKQEYPVGDLEFNGRLVHVDFRVLEYTLNQINQWGNKGKYKIIVCMDQPIPAKKAYFRSILDGKEYKDGRSKLSDVILQTIDVVAALLNNCGIPVCQLYNYEADDLVFSILNTCKKKYPNTPIDIVTNDCDLLPLVDEQVSVFLKSTKFGAADKSLYHRGYMQVTPENYQEVLEAKGDYKGIQVPYNTILLFKMLRGDKSDGIPGLKKKFPPKKYNTLIENMIKDNVDFTNIFRYGETPIINRVIATGEITKNPENYAREELHRSYGKPKELLKILEVLSNYVDEETLQYIEGIYCGLNLNQPYMTSKEGNNFRTCARVQLEPHTYNVSILRSNLANIGLKLR